METKYKYCIRRLYYRTLPRKRPPLPPADLIFLKMQKRMLDGFSPDNPTRHPAMPANDGAAVKVKRPTDYNAKEGEPDE